MPRVKIDGHEIFYEKFGQKTSLPPLIFLHGISSSTIAWREQLKFFKDYTEVYAYDQLGQGRSSKPKIEYDLRYLSKILYLFIKKFEIKNPIIIGHSMGGFINQIFALKYPNISKKLVLVCTGPKLFIDLPANFLAKVGTPILKIYELIYYKMYHIMNASKGSKEKPREILTNEISSAISASAQAITSIVKYLVLTNLTKIVEKIKIPVLFISAEKDPFLKFTQFYKNKLKADIFIIKGGEHTPFETFKDQFNPKLLEFIKK
ncbi:MAG: alpha/beta hydrolase [Candidatus Lokiarchaeota archaeon]|nr:alpha/beta hydrolase [Candidatus Lokiarchaeota archaeon]